MRFFTNKRLKVISLTLSFALIFQFAFSSIAPQTVYANTSSKISYSIVGSPNVSNTISILVNVSNAQNLYGGSIDFVYDKSLIEIQNIEKGSIWGGNAVEIPVKSYGNGQASAAVMLKGSNAGVSGNGSLLVIKAKVLKEGSIKLKTTSNNTGLSLSGDTIRVKLSNSDGDKLSYSAEDKYLALTNEPQTITSYEEDNSLITYSSPWQTEVASSNSGGKGRYTNVTNNYFSFTFEGTGFRWYGLANSAKGIANIYIDGVKQEVDTYSKYAVYNTLFFEASGLSKGKHTVKIEVSGQKNPQATSAYLHIDKLEIINGKLTAPETFNSYEETNPLIKYTGSWSNEATSNNSGGNGKFSNEVGASFTFAFEGTGFRWYGLANSAKGIANVYIDGQKETVDGYSKYAVYNTLFLEKSGLSKGRHTVTIEVTPDKNPAATSAYVHVDRIDIINGSLVDSSTPVSYEEDSPLIKFDGPWTNEPTSSNSGGNGKYSSKTGASFSFNFEGTGFKWYGLANSSKGIAKVIVDGKEYKVDGYAKYAVYDYKFFELTNLTSGKHTVKIEVTAEKNPAATNTNVHVDRIEILNGTMVSSPTDAFNTYEEDNSLIKYTGSWSEEITSNNSGGKGKYTNQVGATISFNFEGTGFRWYGLANSAKGIANVYVDGKKYTADGYSKYAVYNTKFFELSNLTTGKHTVTIEVTPDKNPAATSAYVHIDKIEVLNGKLTTAPADSVTSYEENNKLIQYGGTWTSEITSNNSGGEGKFTNQKGATISFNFQGTGFRWYGLANSAKGIANVYVDGKKYTVDGYSKYAVYNTKFFELSNLAPGSHNVKIEVTSDKNPAATSTYVHIDKLEILNGKLLSTTNSFEENNLLINYSGSWTDEITNNNSGGKGKFSNQVGASITFSFEGSGFRWYGLANSAKGIANVYVDGVKQKVDGYSKYAVYNTLFLEVRNLENKKHTVKIEVTPEKNPLATSAYVHIDKLEIIDGTLVPTVDTFTSYEENNSLITYKGSWANEATSNNSGGNGKYSNQVGASFSFTFDGTGFKWYGLANSAKGIADVYIDGVKQKVDGYSKYAVYNTLFLEMNNLPKGKHTVTVEVTPYKNSQATSAYVHIDKIEIINGSLVK